MAKWADNTKEILEARYLIKDKKGVVLETPDNMLVRVSKHISNAEKTEELKKQWDDKFMSILDTLEFLPNSPTLMNAGRELGQLSACFVLNIEDDLSNIFEQVKQTALIHKSGGGTGLIFSHLRPSNSMVNSTSGVASGPVSFMRVFDTATDVVKQGGVRRGANIGILHVSHPNIFDFVKCKEDLKSFQNFNISVAMTNNFMKAVEQGNGYPLINPRTHEKTYIKANDLFNEICKQAWTTGDPGLFFIDAANNKNPTPWFGQFECVNPCGENPLLANESCNLGSIDVSKMVLENKKFDWDRLAEVVAISVRFLDNVITANNFPTIKIQRASLRTRKVGLGLMGFADTLILMGMRYDSEQAVKFAKRLMMNIRETAHMVSRDLGKEKGFGELERLKRRNATLTTIAPTGTLSILADCSSGIEPIFKKNFTKTVLGNVKINLGKKYQKIDDNLLITAGEISIEKHVEMQSAFQQYTDNAVSKTINLDNKSTVVDVTKAFKLAFASGCKGITIFRDGCRPEQMLENVTGELSECDGNKCSI